MKLTHCFFVTVSNRRPANLGWPSSISGVDFKIVDGFDFRKVDNSQIADNINRYSFLMKYKRLPTGGEVGCALAHRFCWETLFEDDGDVALIIEDDFALVDPNFEELLTCLLSRQSWDIISLMWSHGLYSKTDLTWCGREIAKSTLIAFGTHGYLITKKTANLLLLVQKPRLKSLADWPVDTNRINFFSLKDGCGFIRDPLRSSTASQSDGISRLTVVDRLMIMAGHCNNIFFRLRLALRLFFRSDIMK